MSFCTIQQGSSFPTVTQSVIQTSILVEALFPAVLGFQFFVGREPVKKSCSSCSFYKPFETGSSDGQSLIQLEAISLPACSRVG